MISLFSYRKCLFLYIGVLDILMMYGAYSTTRSVAVSRVFLRFLWFSVASVFICFLYVYVSWYPVEFSPVNYILSWCFCLSPSVLFICWFGCACSNLRKALQEESKLNGNSVVLRIYVFVLGIYAGVHIFFSSLMRIPACHQLTNRCDHWFLVRFVKWMHQVCVLLCFLMVFYMQDYVFLP